MNRLCKIRLLGICIGLLGLRIRLLGICIGLLGLYVRLLRVRIGLLGLCVRLLRVCIGRLRLRTIITVDYRLRSAAVNRKSTVWACNYPVCQFFAAFYTETHVDIPSLGNCVIITKKIIKYNRSLVKMWREYS